MELFPPTFYTPAAQIPRDSSVGNSELVDAHHLTHTAFVDIKRGQVRQKVVTREKTKKHKVVDDALEIIRKGKRHVAELLVKSHVSHVTDLLRTSHST